MKVSNRFSLLAVPRFFPFLRRTQPFSCLWTAATTRTALLPKSSTLILPFPVSNSRTMSTITTPTTSSNDQSYSAAVEALNTLQSNAAVIEAIRKSGGRLLDHAIPEMIEYLERIGYSLSDLNRLNVIHITGTKGKGSTSAFCDSLFRQLVSTPSSSSSSSSTAKVGLYTSPHMCAVRERIRINGKPISEEMFAKYFWQVWYRLSENPNRKMQDLTPLRPVYFRFLTLLAFHVFLCEKVDATILEVGIGGKYDSTNIVPSPLVTAITQLGLDHTAMLGNTVEEIAIQKAGIFKPNAAALTWKRQPGNSINEMNQAALQNGTKLELIDLHPQIDSIGSLGLHGAHQLCNASLALAIMQKFLQASDKFSPPVSTQNQNPDELQSWQRKGLLEACWPGRCQTVPTRNNPNLTWFLDGAHTTDSLIICLQWFLSVSKNDNIKRTLVFNCTNGRSSFQLLQSILKTCNSKFFFNTVIFTTNLTFSSGSWAADLTSVAIDSNDLETLSVQKQCQISWNQLDNSKQTNVLIQPTIQDSVESILLNQQSDSHPHHVLVTGSLHLVGGILALLKSTGHVDSNLVATHSSSSSQ